MRDFINMRDKLIEHFNAMTTNVDHIFEVNCDKDELYNLYLDSFPAGTNEIFRERREHDCSCCRSFIKHIGNVITIKDGKVDTIWNFETGSSTYQPVLDALDAFVRKHIVTDVYLSGEKKVGCEYNFEEINGKSHRWEHMYLTLPNKFTIRNCDKGTKLNEYRTRRNVFKRSLDELTIDAVDSVLDLCATNSLYKGPEWINQLNEFKKLKKDYEKLTSDVARDLFAWEKSMTINPVTATIRNTSMGTLLIDISEGKDLDTAVRAYEAIVAPSNYKRSKPVYSQKMLDAAQKQIEEMGFMESLPRRHACLDDIIVNDILFANKDAAKRVTGAADIFGELAKNTKGANAPKKFSNVEEISYEDFIKNVLPNVNTIEAFLENKHIANMVSLIAPQNADAKSMFKWGNGFTWAYRGNTTDSMKERVKSFGGKVNGDLRFSIQWNEDGKDNVDLDAHCIEKTVTGTNYEIYFTNKRKLSPNGGMLDVDIISPNRDITSDDKTAVENIIYADRRKMKQGVYTFFVHQYSGSAKNGFRAEIEFDGVIHAFNYPYTIRTGETVNVAEVTYNADGTFTIKELIPSTTTSKDMWGLKTNEFVPVTVVCYSPNFWSTAETNTGHKHVFFMLNNCVNPENPSGIFNEFLVQELYQHRHVMEAIGNKMRVTDTPDQLSGIGFATDKRAELIVKVKGATERLLKIKF